MTTTVEEIGFGRNNDQWSSFGGGLEQIKKRRKKKKRSWINGKLLITGNRDHTWRIRNVHLSHRKCLIGPVQTATNLPIISGRMGFQVMVNYKLFSRRINVHCTTHGPYLVSLSLSLSSSIVICVDSILITTVIDSLLFNYPLRAWYDNRSTVLLIL